MTMESSAPAETSEVLQPGAAPSPQGLNPTEREATRTTQGRSADGKFGAKADESKRVDPSAIARNIVRGEIEKERLSRLPQETDGKALDTVKPKGKGTGATADPAPASAEATKSDKSEGTSPGNTAVAKHLDAARKALALDGLTEDDLAGMKPERILALGKKAHDRQADIARKLEDKAKADKAAPATARKAEDGGSQKPATTSPASESDDDDFDAIAKDAVGMYDESDEHFSKSMGKLAKSIHASIERKFTASLEKTLEAHAEKLATRLNAEFEFERAVDSLKAEFPQLDTQDGRDALVPILESIATAGTAKNIRDGVKASAYALWGEERERTKAEAAKAHKNRDARSNGQPVSGQSSPAQNRQGTQRDSELALVRAEIEREKQGR